MLTGFMAALIAVGCQSSPLEPQAEVASVEVSPAELSTRAGTLARFQAVARDAAGKEVAGAFVDWTTSDPSIAIIDSDGYVWTFQEGTATATASAPGRGKGAANGNAYGHAKKDAQVQVTQIEADRPGRVTDLSVTGTTTNSISLSFTEVDDGMGGAAEYLVRFETAPLDWGTADDVSNGTCSAPLQGSGPGSDVSCSVQGLDVATKYEFQVIAIRAGDEVYGDLSNVATGTTDEANEPEPESTPTANGEYPNEPDGFTPISSLNFTSGVTAQVGDCTAAPGQMEYISDSTSPTGTEGVLRAKFPDGGPDGQAYWRFDCWGPDQDDGGGSYQYDEIYISLRMKVEGTDFENQSVGTKIFYWASGTGQSHNDHALYLHNGTGHQAIQSEVSVVTRLSEITDDGKDSPGLLQGVPTNAMFRMGEWNHIEVRAKINEINPTKDNGELEVWLNGTLITSVNNWRYRSDDLSRAFYHLQVTPVWGGSSGDVRTRDDFWRVDELYISARQ